MFADDTAIYACSDTREELELILQDDLHSVSEWLRYNRLSINTKKTKVMQIGSQSKIKEQRELNLYINRNRLDNVSEFLYLGVLIDSGLKMNAHVEMTYDKCVTKLGLISKTRYLFDSKTAKMLYISLILPILDYCGSVFMIAPKRDLEKLQRLQNVALRIVLKVDCRHSVYRLHEACNLDTLAIRREKSLLKLCYNWVHGDGPDSLCKIMLPRENPIHHTRQSINDPIPVPRVRTSMGEKAIAYRAPKYWSTVRDEFKLCTKVEQLKRKLRVVWDTFD